MTSSANMARGEVAGALARGPAHQAQRAGHPGFGKGTGVLTGAHAHHVLAHVVVAQIVQRRRGVELGAVVEVGELAQQLKLLAAVGQPRVAREADVAPASCALRPSNSMRAPLRTPQKTPAHYRHPSRPLYPTCVAITKAKEERGGSWMRATPPTLISPCPEASSTPSHPVDSARHGSNPPAWYQGNEKPSHSSWTRRRDELDEHR